ncbi:hypothetical protein RHSIM_Rhsim06G0159600 [Rhododendron simsii]|uniref:Late embryogenesis abundant protein LEA-2 subgroup domain-containing protein n=1 Tax=Rhododendron simsii TaxID=118357 RepID=A0A834GSL2_RHOSS|nr:hypothetical protein RHSIM_Rhsim06G0159600 [Rhododendron simsii]
MPGAKSFPKGLKICCAATFVLLIVFTTVCVTLYFTMFKPKQPQVTAHPVSLENIEVQIFPFRLNVTIGLVITINNRNYGSFKYKNSTSYIEYHGTNVAEVPIEGETVPARRKLNLSTHANVAADKLITNSHFLSDLIAGSFNLTSKATLRVISLILYFAMLKPKEPHVTPHPASLENIQLRLFPKFRLNVTLGMVITIRNPNYGSFKYKNTKAYISYRGTNIAEVSIEPEVVPARGELNIRTHASVTADKLVLNHHFLKDLVTGRFDLTSRATLQGTVSVLKVFKLRAEVFSTCDISIVVLTRGLESKCESKIRL